MKKQAQKISRADILATLIQAWTFERQLIYYD
jgi:hypothetical protein